MLVSALLLVCPLLPQPWRLTLPMFSLTFCFSFCRPAGNNLILEQVERDTGTASALMVFSYFMTGALAMWLFSFDWHDKMAVLAVMGSGAMLVALLLWGLVKRRLRPLSG
jgi:DHA1 family bicyclomycin/chloramphenicol resistance-like MFS transporter